MRLLLLVLPLLDSQTPAGHGGGGQDQSGEEPGGRKSWLGPELLYRAAPALPTEPTGQAGREQAREGAGAAKAAAHLQARTSPAPQRTRLWPPVWKTGLPYTAPNQCPSCLNTHLLPLLQTLTQRLPESAC